MKIKICSILLVFLPLVSYAQFKPEAARAAGNVPKPGSVGMRSVCPSPTDLPLTLTNGEKISCFFPSKVSSDPRCVVGEDPKDPRNFVYNVQLSKNFKPVDKIIICKGDDRSGGCAYNQSLGGQYFQYIVSSLKKRSNQVNCFFSFVPPDAILGGDAQPRRTILLELHKVPVN